MAEEKTRGSTGRKAGGADSTPDPPAARRTRGCPFVLVVLIALASSLATVGLYDRYFATKIVAVDLKGFLGEQKVALASGTISESDLARRLDALEATLDTIPEWHAVILGDAVVRHVEVIKP